MTVIICLEDYFVIDKSSYPIKSLLWKYLRFTLGICNEKEFQEETFFCNLSINHFIFTVIYLQVFSSEYLLIINKLFSISVNIKLSCFSCHVSSLWKVMFTLDICLGNRAALRPKPIHLNAINRVVKQTRLNFCRLVSAGGRKCQIKKVTLNKCYPCMFKTCEINATHVKFVLFNVTTVIMTT